MLPFKKIITGVALAGALSMIPSQVSGQDGKQIEKKELHKNGTEFIAENKGDAVSGNYSSYEKTLMNSPKWTREIDGKCTLFEDSFGKIKLLIREKTGEDVRSNAAEAVNLQAKLDEVDFRGKKEDIEVIALKKGESYFVIPKGAKACIGIVDRPDEGWEDVQDAIITPSLDKSQGYIVGESMTIKRGDSDGKGNELLVVDGKFAFVSSSETKGEICGVSLESILKLERKKTSEQLGFEDLEVKAFGNYHNYNEETKTDEVWHWMEVKNNKTGQVGHYGVRYIGVDAQREKAGGDFEFASAI